VNLEIAQAVSQRRLSLSTTLYPGQKCVEASDDVIKGFISDPHDRVKLFRIKLDFALAGCSAVKHSITS
jgi:hypothetical protein